MKLADRVMMAAAPSLRPPQSVRQGDFGPLIVRAPSTDLMFAQVVTQTRQIFEDVGNGNIAVICPDELADAVSAALTQAGVAHGRANNTALDTRITVVPVSLIKGLELDGVVVVEPAAIVAAQQYGLRALYVALTRATQRLTVVHCLELPPAMIA